MQNTYIIKLKFRSPIRIGTYSDEVSTCKNFIDGSGIPSDTLYSALLTIAQKLYGNKWIEDFISKPFFRLSSIFPLIDNKPLLPFPPLFNTSIKKFLREKEPQCTAEKQHKKHLEWLVSWNAEYIENSHKTCDALYNYFDYTVTTRAAIPRIDTGQETEPFTVAYIHSKREYSSYFLVAFDGDTTDLEKLISFLGSEGLGSERTYGWGNFEYKLEKAPHELTYSNETDGYSISLSRFIPQSHDNLLSFDLSYCGGWSLSSSNYSYKRKAFHAVKEGALLQRRDDGISNFDLTPSNCSEHKIWRVLLNFPISVNKDLLNKWGVQTS